MWKIKKEEAIFKHADTFQQKHRKSKDKEENHKQIFNYVFSLFHILALAFRISFCFFPMEQSFQIF